MQENIDTSELKSFLGLNQPVDSQDVDTAELKAFLGIESPQQPMKKQNGGLLDYLKGLQRESDALRESFTGGVETITHGIMQPIFESQWGENFKGLGNETLANLSRNYKNERQAKERLASEINPVGSKIYSGLGMLGGSLPVIGAYEALAAATTPAVAGAASPLSNPFVSNPIIGAALGGSQYVDDNNWKNRAVNAGIGGVLGTVFPAAVAAGNYLGDAINPSMQQVAKRIMGPVTPEEVLPTLKAGREIGVNLRPDEAAGSAAVVKNTGGFGKSNETARLINTNVKSRYAEDQATVGNFLNKISPDDGNFVTLYHGTTPKGSEGIMKSGLKPGFLSVGGKKGRPIESLTTNPSIADNYSREKSWLNTPAHKITDEMKMESITPTTLKIKIPKSEMDNYIRQGSTIKDASGQSVPTYFLKKPIPSQYIKAYDSKIDNLTPQQQLKLSAQSVINSERTALNNIADPYYEKAKRDIVPMKKIQELMKFDGNIEDAINKAQKDPTYRAEMAGYAPNSIKVLDKAKRILDDRIEAAKGTSVTREQKDLVRVLNDSRKRLIAATDELSPNYKQARKIYESNAGKLNELEFGPVGKIADTKDIRIDKLSTDIFNLSPRQIDKLRQKLRPVNSEAWDANVRNYFEQKLKKTGQSGYDTYKTMLGNKEEFNKLIAATKDSPGATKWLVNAKSAFKDVSNPITARTQRGYAATGVDKPRLGDAQLNWKQRLLDVLGSKIDERGTTFLTDPKWEDIWFKGLQEKPVAYRNQGISTALTPITANAFINFLNEHQR